MLSNDWHMPDWHMPGMAIGAPPPRGEPWRYAGICQRSMAYVSMCICLAYATLGATTLAQLPCPTTSGILAYASLAYSKEWHMPGICHWMPWTTQPLGG